MYWLWHKMSDHLNSLSLYIYASYKMHEKQDFDALMMIDWNMKQECWHFLKFWYSNDTCNNTNVLK